jgi:hypothetical protein
MGKNIHVTYHQESGKWAVKAEGAEKAANLFDTKAEAMEAGRVRAMAEKSELVIHGEDGRIQDSDSYGNDPFPPRDRVH